MSESEQEYVYGVKRYKLSKPLVVMEVGTCAYEGAAVKGPAGFAILQGTNADGSPIYEGGKAPICSKKQQADYVEKQVNLLRNACVEVCLLRFCFSNNAL
jgi:hypothetical protein